MIITIEGKRGEGKTMLAREITKGKRAVWINEYRLDSQWWTGLIDKTTEFIVFDEISDINKLNHLINADSLIIQKPMKPPYLIPMPSLILIHQSE